MLFEPNRTQFDLHFRLFGTPVRVHPMFWLISAALGWDFIKLGIEYVLVWVGCVFVSILLHEFGHLWAGQVFGSSGNIVLYSFGGLAVGSNDLRNRWQRIFVFLAGPGIQLVLFGLLSLLLWQQPSLLLRGAALHPLVGMTFVFLLEINWWWPVMNLLPIWPLDGGQISRELFQWRMGSRGVRASLIVSMVVAGLIAVNSFSDLLGGPTIPYVYTGGGYGVFLFGLLALQSYLTLHQLNMPRAMRTNYEADDRMPWERDPDWWKQGSGRDDR